MSCHDIGRGVDFIMEKVLKFYDEGKISKEVAQEMLNTFPTAVNYCDGNEYEAQETLTQTHCIGCLRKYNSKLAKITIHEADDILKKEDFFDESKYNYSWWFKAMESAGLNGRSLCSKCFKKVFEKTLKPEAIKKILESIDKNKKNKKNLQKTR